MQSGSQKREREYQQAMTRYQAELQEWHRLTEEQKAQRANASEVKMRRIWSFFLAVSCSYFTYDYLSHSLVSDKLWTTWIMISVPLFVVSLIFARFLGKFVRAAVYASIGGFICNLLTSIFMDDASKQLLDMISIGVSLLLFILGVFTNAFKADGVPKAPIKKNDYLD